MQIRKRKKLCLKVIEVLPSIWTSSDIVLIFGLINFFPRCVVTSLHPQVSICWNLLYYLFQSMLVDKRQQTYKFNKFQLFLFVPLLTCSPRIWTNKRIDLGELWRNIVPILCEAVIAFQSIDLDHSGILWWERCRRTLFVNIQFRSSESYKFHKYNITIEREHCHSQI